MADIKLDRIGWQDGTLVSKGKVEINGTIYEVEPEQYSGQTPLSCANLKKMENNTEKAINELKKEKDGTTLYENETGTTGNIVLSEKLSNYKYIKVFWKVGNNNRGEEVSVALNKNINLSLIDFTDSKIWIHTKTMTMEDTKLTVKRYKEYSITDSSQWTPYGSSTNSIAIVKVVGYK